MSKSRLTQFQIKSLVELTAKYPLLCAGKSTQRFTHKQPKKKWEIIASELNALPGEKKLG